MVRLCCVSLLNAALLGCDACFCVKLVFTLVVLAVLVLPQCMYWHPSNMLCTAVALVALHPGCSYTAVDSKNMCLKPCARTCQFDIVFRSMHRRRAAVAVLVTERIHLVTQRMRGLAAGSLQAGQEGPQVLARAARFDKHLNPVRAQHNQIVCDVMFCLTAV